MTLEKADGNQQEVRSEPTFTHFVDSTWYLLHTTNMTTSGSGTARGNFVSSAMRLLTALKRFMAHLRSLKFHEIQEHKSHR
ncbi:hypothetical protein H5410_025177 [Solanum commersonii]|uniref:Uncharacterized protein n=1 Tax=Solanum commersonii TaxID=4109 RepID=A0A9J5YV10_SOLCO|nr:hypothetical protein H5410_025177 [Solanum commersonii]